MDKQVIEFFKDNFRYFMLDNYNGKFFIAGGVFKKIINIDCSESDVDIFFPSGNDEKIMIGYLIWKGGVIVSKEKYNTKINYKNRIYDCISVKKICPYNLLDLLKSFDIGVSGIGIEYNFGKISSKLLPEAIESIQKKELNLIQTTNTNRFIIPTIIRIKKYTLELGFSIPENVRNDILTIFDNQSNRTNKYNRQKLEALLSLQHNEQKI